MRHGQSQANVADLIISSPELGCGGYGLTELGREQAREWALQSGLSGPLLVYASDFLRTRQTAEIASQVLVCPPPQWEVRLRERFFGEWERTSARHYEPVWDLDGQDSGHTQGGVESALALTARLAALIEELEMRHQDQTVLLVSHGDPLRFLQLWASGRDPRAHQSIRHFSPAEIRALDDLPEPE